MPRLPARTSKSKRDCTMHNSVSYTEVVEVLLKNNASIEAKDKSGNTPLSSAAYWGHSEVVEVLLRNGASTKTRNQDNKTPLRLAKQKGHTHIVNLLQNNAT